MTPSKNRCVTWRRLALNACLNVRDLLGKTLVMPVAALDVIKSYLVRRRIMINVYEVRRA